MELLLCLSPGPTARAEAAHCTKEKFCLNGYVLTKDADMAYRLSRPRPTQVTDEDVLHKMALRWLRKKEVKAYLDEVFAISFNHAKEESPNFRRKEDVVAELNQLATSVKEPKLKAEILLKLADLQQMKKEESKEDMETIHYYLPLTCNNCGLYQKRQRQQQIELSQKQQNQKQV